MVDRVRMMRDGENQKMAIKEVVGGKQGKT
jgi:hypothetical protein